MSLDIRIRAVHGLPEVLPGADLAALVAGAAGPGMLDGAIVVIAHKLVSKAEGRVVDLQTVHPTAAVAALADASGRDPRHTQVILDEAAEVIRAERGVLICRTHHGFVCANAGVDLSNAGPAGDRGGERAILLPLDPDGSARRIRADLRRRLGGSPVAVLVVDSFGRAWRVGQVDVAIGAAGLDPARGPSADETDRDGRPLLATLPAVADELAAAAGLARRKAGGDGVVLVTGLADAILNADGPGAAALVRPAAEDLFGARTAD